MSIRFTTIANQQFVVLEAAGKTVTLAVQPAIDYCQSRTFAADAIAASAESEAVALANSIGDALVAGTPTAELRDQMSDIKARYDAAKAEASEHADNLVELLRYTLLGQSSALIAAADAELAAAIAAHPVPEQITAPESADQEEAA